MPISACMQCLKTCGYLCGGLAGLNIWFFIGMTVFNAMDNPWLKQEVFQYESYSDDASKFTTVFGACIAVSTLSSKTVLIALRSSKFKSCYSPFVRTIYFQLCLIILLLMTLAQFDLHDWMLLLH